MNRNGGAEGVGCSGSSCLSGVQSRSGVPEFVGSSRGHPSGGGHAEMPVGWKRATCSRLLVPECQGRVAKADCPLNRDPPAWLCCPPPICLHPRRGC